MNDHLAGDKPDQGVPAVTFEARVERMVESCGASWWVTLFRSDRPEDAMPWDAGRISLFQFREELDMEPPAEFRARETAAEFNEFFRSNADNPTQGHVEAPVVRAPEELLAGYRQAIEDIGDWAAYASDYFQEKHMLKECIEGHKKTLANHEGKPHAG